ncbi:Sodium/hydrogen exchanger family protein [Coccidioides posadasii C735 delta SOWgp]|uniref:K(+)/H(+) antiporter 1 n=2 Tax=Coccidioides posadasii TaxID=199306 RepID=A0A0J6F9U9_COCPO|nr:Sodium/hydrogen exchanger family protein [Coccidioides posadasii C735 delta SOWgp]EER27229.1 Sodium/hydrogen exchanger family protein [Coccidioides posadasii C735 delta SOWgp]KMM66983.1 K(+)/H(+) antiporter 1 [Coccidioides posadasii RMSCC 3488]|eukprot:XP_003069374.1 Sodium/hydrogen exchanger family protein [Coccidioides posadasii C735 delta SOWgp]
MALVVAQTGTVGGSAAPAAPTNRATPQGGIFDRLNPSQYDPKNPLTLFIIQASIIVIFCRLLHFPLSKIRQPRVISEVIGGILLGPSVMGRIPGFRDAIFPEESLPNLNLVANLGLVLFLFMIGVETNIKTLTSNWKVAVGVSAAGMILPFGLGCGIAYGLYHEFRNDPGLAPISFGTYMLFIGIAMAITAFPVLCRILTELELLNTNVGVIVLSAGVGNDVVGWVLLALCVALVNANTGITALWVLLACIGFTLFLIYAVRPVFHWFLKRTGSLHDGPNQSVVALTLLLALAAAFFTQVIGVHAIFGGFLVGIICPHDGGFAIKLTEKIEDVIGALFLPLYFALSGLNTNVGLLNSGIVWGYVFAVVFIAFIAKVTGGMLASRFHGLLWRESATIGVLMSCKGLVELIVLNIGLQAKILSSRTFTIFIVMALITTFATTPLTLWLYPEWYQTKVDRWRRGEIDWDGNVLDSESDHSGGSSDLAQQKARSLSIRKLMVYLRLDNLPGLFTFISLLGADDMTTVEVSKTHHSHDSNGGDRSTSAKRNKPVEVHGIRLIELTDRDSSVMKVSEVHDYSFSDPILNTFRTFAQLNRVAVSGAVVIAPEHAYAETLVNKARDFSSDFMLIPWSETGAMSERQIPFLDVNSEKFATGPHSTFISNILKNSKSHVGILVNNGFGGPALTQPKPGYLKRTISGRSLYRTNDLAMMPSMEDGHHIFFPYFGGDDDQVVLRLVLQLAKNATITATIAHIVLDDTDTPASSSKNPAVFYGLTMAPEEKEADSAFFNTIRDSLPSELTPRVIFQTIHATTTDLISATLQTAKLDVGKSNQNRGDIVIVGRNSVVHGTGSSFGLATSAQSGEIGSEARKALGVLGESMATNANDVKASVLVVQAGKEG